MGKVRITKVLINTRLVGNRHGRKSEDGAKRSGTNII